MSCGSDQNEAGGSISRQEDPQGMESESSSGSDDTSSSDGSTTSGCSPTTPETPLSPPPELRRAHIRSCLPQRFRRSLAHVACQTDYTEEWQPMKDKNGEEMASTSEGTLRLMIQNFKSMQDTVRGPSKEIQGVSWRIMVMPRQHVVQKKGTQKCLGFFLQCCPEAYSELWSCQAQAELRLISQKTGIPHFTRKTNHNYTAKENDWGYSCFMTWADILDENQGYIKEDKVVLEVTVNAEPPKNILSHEEFRRRIAQWKDLAEMHFARSCIDLAIEANFQALKYCKDRDLEIKGQLEEQRNYFIEQKVQESIQRIEKGKDHPIKHEDEGTSQTALKQALTQSTKHAMKKGNKTPKKPKSRARDPSRSPPASPPPSEVRVEDMPKTETAAMCKNIPLTSTFITKMIEDGGFADNLEDMLLYMNCSKYSLPPEFDLAGVRDNFSWIRRSRTEDDVYNSIVQKVQQNFERLNLTLEDAAKFDDYSESIYDKDDQSAFFQQMLENDIRETLEKTQVKAERITFAMQSARCFTEEVMAKIASTPDESEPINEEVAQLGATLAFIDNEESRLWRFQQIERYFGYYLQQNPIIYNNKIPWIGSFAPTRNTMAQLQPFLTAPWQQDDSDESNISSDSERQTDGCIKAKRTKREKTNFFMHSQTFPARNALVEMAVQTDAVPKKNEETHDALKPANITTPPGRVIKKPQKKNKKIELNNILPQDKAEGRTLTASARAAAATLAQAHPGVNMLPTQIPSAPLQPNIYDDPLNNGHFRVIAARPLKGSFGIFTPRAVPMEHAMRFFPTCKSKQRDPLKNDSPAEQARVMEEWVRSWLQESQRIRPANGSAPITGAHDFIASYSDQNQVVSALSAVALNLMNVRRLTNRTADLMGVFHERSSSIKWNKLHAQLFSMAGVTFEIPSEPTIRPLPDSSQNDGDYILAEQIGYIDEVKLKLEEQIANEKEVSKKIAEALKNIDEKYRTSDKSIAEYKKKCEELDKNSKKNDKVNKQEIQTLKNQLNNEKDRNTSLSKELKEKNKEVKRIDTRCTTITSERDEFTEKFKSLQKDMTALQKKHSDEVSKLRRDMSSLNESRKNLQNGIAERDNELKSFQHQIEERSSQIKKLKNEIEQERQKTAAVNREIEKATERAKRSEVDLLTRDLEAGVALLERAHLDATKHCNEMDDAANNRARSTAEMNTFLANKNEWSSIVEQIDVFIKKARLDYASQIEAIQAGKSLSSLPKISVPKPPNPAPIIKVPVVVPVEPTKTAPGPIGPPRASTSNISPQSRAPGSPILKAPLHSPGSPVRHPGAIGTRPNGFPVNGSSSDRYENHGGSTVLNNWSWPEPLDGLLNHNTGNPDLLSLAPGSRVDQNGWDEQNNTWSNNVSSNVNQYISSPLAPQPRISSSTAMFNHPPGWPRPQSAQHQPTIEQQRMMVFNQFWQPIIDRVSKKLHVEVDQAFQMVRQYVQENNINHMATRVTPDDIIEAIYQKRFAETASRLPPGAAPGYLQNPLMGSLLDRNPIGMGSMNSHDHLLNNLLAGDSMRPSSSTEASKWSF